MALPVKDGNGTLTSLKTTLTGSDHMPHHIVQAVSGTVAVTSSAASPLFVTSSNAIAVTASSANPVYITGAVNVSQPISVDLVVGDNVFVTSSLSAPLYVSSSDNSPILVTGTVSVNNYPSTVTVTASFDNPIAVTGNFTTTVSDGLRVTSSYDNPIFVVNDQLKPVYVTASLGNPVLVSVGNVASTNATIVNTPVVTSSFTSPVYVSSSYDRPVFVSNDQLKPVYVTSSEAYPVVVKEKIATSTSRNTFSSFASTIDWAGTGSSNISGTFILANSSSFRRGLMFANNTNKDLYIALGDNDFASTNGFGLTTTSSAPAVYSFILYPSGTYFADQSFVNIKHSGFFVSSSNIDVQITIVATE